MSSIGHIMGVHIETDMRRDAFDHLLRLDHTYYNNTCLLYTSRCV